MIVAIVLSNLLGTWSCTKSNEPGALAFYALHANHAGTLVSYYPRASLRVTRHFTFTLTRNNLVERFTDPGSEHTELHTVRLNDKHFTDEAGLYWHEGRWTALSTNEVLYCRR